MKQLLLTTFFYVCIYDGYAQCTNVPVQEAIRNGDFEAGYLKGAAGKNHQFTPGSDFDFYSDFNFIGQPTYQLPSDPCNFNIADKYAVMAAETFTCGNQNAPFVNNTYWGISYGGDKNFKDHTLGANGKGHALVIDLYQIKTSSKNLGGLPMAWEQTVDIAPSQPYYFSSWLANFNASTPAKMQVTIMPIKADGSYDTPNAQTLPIAVQPVGVMQWVQLSAKWTPTGVYNKVSIRFEFVNVNGGASGLDVAIDDISFINGCQNLNGQNAYVADFQLPDTLNLCLNNGSVTLDPHAPAAQINNASVYWYSGNTNPQTQVSTGNWTKNITTSGTFRVCIDDPDNNCAVSDNIVVIENMIIPVSDLELCTPSQYTLDAGFNIPNGAASSIAWNGPSGSSSTRNYTVNKPGVHTVNISSAVGLSCSYSKTFSVTSRLPNPPNNIDFCSGGGVSATLTMGDEKPYRWSTSQSMSPLIGTGTSVNWNVPANTNADQTLWVQSAETTPLGVCGPTTASMNGFPNATAHVLSFSISQTVQFSSFVVNSPAFAGPCQGRAAGALNSNAVTFTLTCPDGTTKTITQTMNCGSATTITSNWILIPGTYSLSANIRLSFANTPGTNSLGGVVKIISTGETSFGDLNFSLSNACDPVPVMVKAVSCCAVPNDIPRIDVAASTIGVCSPNKATVVTKALTNGLDFKWQVSHNNGTTWTDTISGTIAGGKATLANVSASGWYRIVIANAGNIGKSCVKRSDSAVVQIKDLPLKPTVTVNPNKAQFCKGEAHTLTALSTVSGGGTISYLWKIDASGSNATVNGLTTVGTHNYKVIASANGCSDSTTKSIVVSLSDSVKILSAGPFCSSDAPYNLQLTAGSTTGGTWNGSGVSAATGIFNPVGLIAGSYKIKYSTNGSCSAKDSITIQITNGFSFQFLATQKTSYCLNSSVDTIKVNTAGGVFWTKNGLGITNAFAGYFNPALASVGTDTLFYGKAGQCGDTVKIAISINAAEIAQIIGAATMCSSEAAKQMQVSLLSNAGSWSASCGVCISSSGLFNPAVASANNVITYTTTGACPATDTIHLAVVSQVIADITTADNTNICVDNGLYQINKSVSTSSGGTWTSLPVGLVNSSGQFNSQAAGVGGPYKIIYSVGSNLCSAKDSVILNVAPRENAKITTGNTLTLCSSAAPVQLNTLNPGGVWYGTGVNANGLFDPSSLTAGVTYSVLYKLNGQCGDADTILISVESSKDASIQTLPSMCSNSGKKQLIANAPGGVFSGAGINPSGLFDPAAVQPGSYWIKYTQNGTCPSGDSIQITIAALPSININSDVVQACIPFTVNFSDSISATANSTQWNFGDGTSVAGNNLPVAHTFTSAGTFDVWLKVNFQNGCADSTKIKITAKEVPVADFSFGPQPVGVNNPEVNFNNESRGATSYIWDFGNLASPLNSSFPDETVLFSVAHTDTIPITLIASNDACADTITKKVFFKDVFTLYVPNVFSPNGDGLNDLFFVDGINHTCEGCNNFEFLIFNRWGEIVFQTNTPKQGWNGKKFNTMNDAEIDVYVWKLIYTDSYTGKSGLKTGQLTLMR